MANLQSIIPGGFNAALVEPQESRDYSPLAPGVYVAEITNAEIKELKSGNGTGLSLEFTIVTPEQFANRKVWQNLNIRHSNEQAEQIAQAQLSALCRAVGIDILKDSDELIQRMVQVRLKIRQAKDGYAASNDVTGYEAVGASPVKQPEAAPKRQAAPASKAPLPWKR